MRLAASPGLCLCVVLTAASGARVPERPMYRRFLALIACETTHTPTVVPVPRGRDPRPFRAPVKAGEDRSRAVAVLLGGG